MEFHMYKNVGDQSLDVFEFQLQTRMSKMATVKGRFNLLKVRILIIVNYFLFYCMLPLDKCWHFDLI